MRHKQAARPEGPTGTSPKPGRDLYLAWLLRYGSATMEQDTKILIIFCTAPDGDTGRRIAEELVEYRLAACVNLLPGIESVYRWQGEVQRDSEVLLLIKARASDYAEVEAAIMALHPYELPEIVAVPLSGGLPAYLDWVAKHDEAT